MMSGLGLGLIVIFSDTVVEQLVEGFVSVTVKVSFPDAPQFTEVEIESIPDMIVPPLSDQAKLFPEFATE